MGEIVRAQAWQGASSALANLSSTFINLLPIADRMIGQAQTKEAMDEFLRRVQEVKDDNGNKTDAATQLFSLLFGYNPTDGVELDKQGLDLAQNLLDLSRDALNSKDTEGYKQGLKVIKGDMDAIVKKLQIKGKQQQQPGARPGVAQFGPEGITPQRLESQTFRTLQAQQRVKETQAAEISKIGPEVQAAFPRATKELKSFVEGFSKTLDTEDFNELIQDFIKTKQERMLAQLKAETEKLRSKNLRLGRLLRPPPPSAPGKAIEPILKDKLKDVKKIIEGADSAVKDLDLTIASLEKSQVLLKNEEVQERIKQLRQKIKSVPINTKFAKQKLKGLEKIFADFTKEIQTVGFPGGTPPAEFVKRMQEFSDEIDESKVDLQDSLAQAFADSTTLLENITGKKEEEEPGLVERGFEFVKGAVKTAIFGPPGPAQAVEPIPAAPPRGGPAEFGVTPETQLTGPIRIQATDNQGNTRIIIRDASELPRIRQQAQADGVTLKVLGPATQ